VARCATPVERRIDPYVVNVTNDRGSQYEFVEIRATAIELSLGLIGTTICECSAEAGEAATLLFGTPHTCSPLK
jgi:hypothetical protein